MYTLNESSDISKRWSSYYIIDIENGVGRGACICLSEGMKFSLQKLYLDDV